MPESNVPFRTAPVTASEGIHETLVTDDSTRMFGSSPATVRVREYVATAVSGEGVGHHGIRGSAPLAAGDSPPCRDRSENLEWSFMGDGLSDGVITVFLADDNLIVREGVRALLALEPDL